MEACSASTESGDGRTVFAMTPNGQLKMPRIGNYCLTMVGDGASDVDVAQGAHLAATSSNAQHGVKNLADGDAQSYWSSGSDPAVPVDVQLDFGAARRIKVVEIDWEYPAQVLLWRRTVACLLRPLMLQAFELQVASDGGWTSVYGTSGNNLQTTGYVGPAVSGTALRIRMTKAGPLFRVSLCAQLGYLCLRASRTRRLEIVVGMRCKSAYACVARSCGVAMTCWLRYGIKDVRVVASATRAIVQDCVEAEDNTDARDKFFMCVISACSGQWGSLLQSAFPGLPCLSLTLTQHQLQNRARLSWELHRDI